MENILIVDYGMGNLSSVSKKLKRLGVEALISSDKSEIQNAQKLILPGVGHFSKAVENIKNLGLWDVLNYRVLNDKIPILGICLGMQLMAKYSEEGNCEGFGWFDANVIKFRIENTLKYKIPHMGWNQIKNLKQSSLTKGLQADSEFYFVHSFHFQCNNEEDVLNETDYAYPFVSAVEKGNIYGVQYHPEKSHDSGEIMLNNFINL